MLATASTPFSPLPQPMQRRRAAPRVVAAAHVLSNVADSAFGTSYPFNLATPQSATPNEIYTPIGQSNMLSHLASASDLSPTAQLQNTRSSPLRMPPRKSWNDDDWIIDSNPPQQTRYPWADEVVTPRISVRIDSQAIEEEARAII